MYKNRLLRLNKMAYTKKVMSGRTYWYKDGKRIAVAKVPDNVKNGKKPSGKKPSGKKPSIKKPSSKKNGNGRPKHKKYQNKKHII